MKRLFTLLAWVALGTPVAVPAAAPAAEIPLTTTQRAALGVGLVEARMVAQAPLASLPAVVKAAGAAARPVVIPLGGTVTRLLAQEGQRVKQGQPLLQLRSREFLEQRAVSVAASSEVELRSAQVRRDSTLVAEGIAPQRRLEESQAALRTARAAAVGHSALLASVRAVHGAPGEYQLLASGAGTLAETGISIGDSLEAGYVAFYLQQGNSVWLEAQLPERLMEQVAVGQFVTAGLSAVTGRVIAVGTTVSPTTRSVLLRALVPSGPGLRPGQNTELVVEAPVPAGTVLVPASAVVHLQGKDVVFVVTRTGFRPVPVKAGLRTAAGTAVSGPGLAGSQLAVSGVGALKSMALAAAASATHAKEP